MSTTNAQGLSRHIPDDVARAVRQHCGFGCVICGSSIYVYEHIEPEFADAHIHDPDAMALLCGSCHGNVTRKYWSKEKVKRVRAALYCMATGFSWGSFDFGLAQPEILFAGSTLKNCVIPLMISQVPVFSIQAPESAQAPFRLSANFFGPHGQPIFRIEDNVWEAIAGSAWDIEFSGGRIEISDQAKSQCLCLRALPPRGIAIERLKMRVGTTDVVGDENMFRVGGMTFRGVVADSCYIGMSL